MSWMYTTDRIDEQIVRDVADELVSGGYRDPNCGGAQLGRCAPPYLTDDCVAPTRRRAMRMDHCCVEDASSFPVQEDAVLSTCLWAWCAETQLRGRCYRRNDFLPAWPPSARRLTLSR
jgi:hypothetical protein